jgi:hypothetical protein
LHHQSIPVYPGRYRNDPSGLGTAGLFAGRSGTLIARFDPQVAMRTGEEVELTVDIDNGHIFDKETEQAIF